MTIEDKKALQQLGEAFATIEEHRAYIPDDLYNAMGDGLMEWLFNNNNFFSTPDLLRQIFPIIAEHALSKETEAKQDPPPPTASARVN